MSISFFDTVAGHQFTEGTVPALIEAINHLSDVVEKRNLLIATDRKEVIASTAAADWCE